MSRPFSFLYLLSFGKVFLFRSNLNAEITVYIHINIIQPRTFYERILPFQFDGKKNCFQLTAVYEPGCSDLASITAGSEGCGGGIDTFVNSAG